MNHELYEVRSKAEYIEDLINGITLGIRKEEVPQHLVDEMFRKLEEIADILDEYYDWGNPED